MLAVIGRSPSYPEAQWRTARAVAERFRIFKLHEPAVSTSAVHLGQVLDLSGRRDEALEAFLRRALDRIREGRVKRQTPAFVDKLMTTPNSALVGGAVRAFVEGLRHPRWIGLDLDRALWASGPRS